MRLVSKRSLKVASVVKKALVEVLHRLGLKYVTISEVSMSSDIKYADVFFWPLKGNSNITQELQQLEPIIRRKVSTLVKLRYMPELRFKVDTTFDSFSKISEVLEKR